MQVRNHIPFLTCDHTLQWFTHWLRTYTIWKFKLISACAYKISELIYVVQLLLLIQLLQWSLSIFQCMFRSQLLYCTQVWQLHLIRIIEQIQRCATKYFVLNDYTCNYKTCLIKLRILPLMYLFELYKIYYLLSINLPTIQFNIFETITKALTCYYYYLTTVFICILQHRTTFSYPNVNICCLA